MAQQTDAQLTTQANVIRNEIVTNANTKVRVADMVQNLNDSKINNDKIVQNVASPNSTTIPSTQALVDAINALIGGAPGALDTLNELAAALNDDANAYTTLANLIATKVDKNVTANRQTASYILVLADAAKLVEMNVAGANNITVPPNTDVAFPVGTQILLSQYGAGQTSVVAGAGVTIRSDAGKLKISAQYAGATLLKIATDEWYLFGSLTA